LLFWIDPPTCAADPGNITSAFIISLASAVRFGYDVTGGTPEIRQ